MNDPLQGIEPPRSNGMAIAALVIGFLSWILSPLAIILGAIALRNPVSKGASIGGIVTGVIGVLICIAWVALFGAAMNAMPEGAMEEIQAEMEKANREAAMTPEERGMAAVEGAASGESGAGVDADAGAGAGASAGGGTNTGDYQATPTGGATAAPAGTSGGK